MMDTQPLPIIHPFGEDDLVMSMIWIRCTISKCSDSLVMLWASTHLIKSLYFHQFAKYIDYYYGDRTILPGRKEMEFMANFCAFQFWQHIFKVKLYGFAVGVCTIKYIAIIQYLH
jgi:hypothetical protein